MKKKGYGRGWSLIIYSFLAYFTATAVGSAMNAASGTLSSLYGWNAALLTGSISIGSVFNIIADAVLGKLSVNHSAKKLSNICFVIYLACMFGLGLTHNLILFIVCLSIANGISNGIGYQLSPTIISKWFPTRKGGIMGIVTIGIPLCSGVATMMYQGGYNALGAFGGFLPFILIAFAAWIILDLFVSDNPEARHFIPDNGAPNQRVLEEQAKEKKAENHESIWTTAKLLRTPQVWAHGIILGTQMLFASGVMVQLYPRLLEIGVDPAMAGVMMLASGLLAIPGSIVSGIIDDHIGTRKAAATSYVFGALAMILNLTGNIVGVWISLIFIALVVGGAANWPASLCIGEFGDDFARGYGVIQPIIQLVGAIGPAFFAVFYGMTGSYRIPYICGAVLMVVSLIAYIFVLKPGFVKREEARVAAGSEKN